MVKTITTIMNHVIIHSDRERLASQLIHPFFWRKKYGITAIQYNKSVGITIENVRKQVQIPTIVNTTTDKIIIVLC